MIDLCYNCVVLESSLDAEKDHSAFLEKLLKILYGEGWDKLTIDQAAKCFILKEGEIP